MEMEGSIEEFSVPEILQFLSLHEANGVLKLKSRREEVHFGFKKGKITDALHRGEELFHSISEYIQRTGLVSSEMIARYKERAKELGLSLLQILERESELSRKDFEEIIAFKIQETTCEVLTWNKGRYAFEAGKNLYQHSAFSVKLEPNTLVMEGMRRIDEWPLIKAALPDVKTVLRKLEKPEIDVKIGKDERTILEKITNDVTLEDLVRTSGIGKFRTYNSVYKLLEIGLIEKADSKTKEKKPPKSSFLKKKQMDFSKTLKKVLLFAFILVHIFFLFKYRLNHVESNIRGIKNLLKESSRLEVILPTPLEKQR